MFKTENIQRFLQANASDAQILDLLTRAEAGTLSFTGCSCLIGTITAKHAALANGQYCNDDDDHLTAARALPYGQLAENEFRKLGAHAPGWPESNEIRLERLVPILQAEISRRASLPVTSDVSEMLSVG